jgi:signal transduction histidine kinase
MSFGVLQGGFSKENSTGGSLATAPVLQRRYGAAGFAAGGLAIFLSLIGMLILQQVDTAEQTRFLIRHTREVLGDVSRLSVLIRDAERGQRGYVLTGRPEYLEPYTAARDQLPLLDKHLLQLVADNAIQQKQVAALQSVIQQKLAELKETIQLRKDLGEEAAKQVVLSNIGWTLMNQATSLLDEAAAEENRMLADRNASIEQADARMRQLTAAGSAAAVLFVAIAAVMLHRGSTRRREIEREKEDQRQELVRSNADLEDFAYAASHDLKAPLRAIAHLVEWVVDDIQATASTDTLDNIKLLQGRVMRLQMLLDGLLAYSRIRRSNTVVESVEIANVVQDVVAMLAPPPGFVVVCEGEMLTVRTHRIPIRVVLENLISNALKHHDRPEGRVVVSSQRVGGVPEIRVSDDGPGIPNLFHDRIFLIFQTLSSRDDVESSGIGLAIVMKHVNANGGRIRVESVPPTRGTSFVLTWKEATP